VVVVVVVWMKSLPSITMLMQLFIMVMDVLAQHPANCRFILYLVDGQ